MYAAHLTEKRRIQQLLDKNTVISSHPCGVRGHIQPVGKPHTQCIHQVNGCAALHHNGPHFEEQVLQGLMALKGHPVEDKAEDSGEVGLQ